MGTNGETAKEFSRHYLGLIMRIDTMTVKKTATATATAATITDLVNGALAIASAQDKLATLAEKWPGDEFTIADGQEFSAAYRVKYLKRFKDRTATQVTSAVTSAMTSVRLSMWLASKRVTIVKNKKITEWLPSEALLKARNLPTAPKTGTPSTAPKTGTPSTAPAKGTASTAPAKGTASTAPAKGTAPSALPTKDAALAAVNQAIAFSNAKNLKINGKPVTDTLSAIGRLIADIED